MIGRVSLERTNVADESRDGHGRERREKSVASGRHAAVHAIHGRGSHSSGAGKTDAMRRMFVGANVLLLIALYSVVDLGSPLYPDNWSLDDSDIFRLMGKIWAQGGIPYVDAWDHKGPLIFFTNMIGYLIGSPTQGVFYVDLVLILVYAFFIWKIVSLTCATCSSAIRVLTFWFSMVVLANIMSPDWDLSETVCFPFLAAALWMALRDIKASGSGAKGITVSPADAYVQGLAVSAAMMTRATNAIAVCVAVMILTVILIRYARWRDLAVSAAMFIVGVLTLFLPFAIYFAVHGAFGEFIYGTFTFNLIYASGSSGSFLSHGKLFALMLLLLPLLVTGTAALSILVRRSIDVEHALYFLSGLAMILMFLRMEPFPHYISISAVFVPSIIVSMCGVLRQRKRVVALLVAALFIFVPYTGYLTSFQLNPALRTGYENPTMERVINQIKDEHASVVLYGWTSAMLYLRYDVNPAVRFFTLQEWQATFSNDYRNRLVAAFEQADSDYVVTLDSANQTSALVIQPVLDSKYRLVATYPVEGHYYLTKANGGILLPWYQVLKIYRLR